MRVFRAAIESQRAAEARLLARLDFAFALHPRDVAQGLPRIEELVGEIIERASLLTASEITEAVDRARSELIEPVLRWAGGGARLRRGWDATVGERVDFFAEQVAIKLEHARLALLDDLRLLLLEAEAFGWAEETVAAILLEDVRKRGRAFGAFRVAVRDAVASVAGQAWTETWTAAWAALEATPSDEAMR